VHRWRVAALIAPLLLTAVVTGLPPVATAAAAPTLRLHQVVLFGSDLPVTSSTGRHLLLSFEVDRFGSGGDTVTDVTIGLYRPSGVSEDHQWEDFVPDSDWQYDATTGDGSIDTGKAFGQFGKLAVSWTGAKQKRAISCDPQERSVKRRVMVSGRVVLRTHSHGPHAWGTVAVDAGQQSAFHASSEAEFGKIGRSCDATLRCDHRSGWMTPSTLTHSHSLIFGETFRFHGRRRTLVQGSWVQPAAHVDPEAVNRWDFSDRFTPSPRIHRLADGGIRVRVRARPSVGVFGSGTFVATGPPKVRREHCGGRTEREWYWTNATFRNGRTPYRIVNQVFGDDVARDGRKAGIFFEGTRPPGR
jgi:hypothetical protein